MSRTLLGLFLVGARNRPREKKRTNRENPQRVPGQIRKIPEKSGKSQKGQKRKDRSRSGNPPRLKPPRLAALDFSYQFKSFSGAVSFCRHAALTNLVVCSFYAKPLFCALLRLLCGLAFALFCAHLRVTASDRV